MYNYWVAQLVLTVFVATSIAYPYKNTYHDVRDNYDPKDVRNLDGIGMSKLANQGGSGPVEKRDVHYVQGYTPSYPNYGGGNLIRDLDILRNRAAMYERQARNLDSLAGITLGSQKRSWADNFNGNDKRNLDEIDHAGFDSFVKKRGFDEIDNVGFDGFVKRNLDEIDRVGFGTFIKRNAPAYPANTQPPSPHN